MNRGFPASSVNVRTRVAAILALLALPLVARSAPPPAAAPTAAAPPATELRLPPDLVYDKVVGPDSAVTFSHRTHVEYESRRCTGCHSKLFKLLAPERRASHRDMDHGGSCGACHDGKHAFDVRATESCVSCHAGRHAAAAPAAAGAAPGFAGPKPFVFARSGDSPGPVTFRHSTHLGHAMTCRSCHPKPFAMKGTAPLPDGAMHEPSACGQCHDGKQSFATDADASCTRCHAEGKGAR